MTADGCEGTRIPRTRFETVPPEAAPNRADARHVPQHVSPGRRHASTTPLHTVKTAIGCNAEASMAHRGRALGDSERSWALVVSARPFLISSPLKARRPSSARSVTTTSHGHPASSAGRRSDSSDPSLTAVWTAYPSQPLLALFDPPVELAPSGPRGCLNLRPADPPPGDRLRRTDSDRDPGLLIRACVRLDGKSPRRHHRVSSGSGRASRPGLPSQDGPEKLVVAAQASFDGR